MAIRCRLSAVAAYRGSLILSVLVAVCLTGCQGPVEAVPASFSGPTMGTAYTVRFVAHADGNTPKATDLQAAVAKRLTELNRRLSTYDAESELSRFNAHRETNWFPVSEETASVVAQALEVAADSNGAFDPTVGPLVNLWGFGPDRGAEAAPSAAAIAAALANVGYSAIEVRDGPPALRKAKPDAYLDLSAIAKGYAVDEVSKLLADRGCEASMVEIGGEVVCRGEKPGGQPWRIGVEKPDATTGRPIQLVVELRDEALATSGDYRNYFERGGARYSHTIDPATGRPVRHNLAAVTVRAADCMTADALATSLLVLGPDAGYDWAEQRGVAALMLLRTNSGFEERTTPAW